MILPFSGCASDPVETYRIGEKLDVAAFRREFGEENVRVVRQDLERYEYSRCTLDRRDARYEIDVSTEGRIVGLTVKTPCGETSDILSKHASIERRLNARYAADAKTTSGSNVEIKIKYEPGSRRLVASCYAVDHANFILAYRRRVRRPER